MENVKERRIPIREVYIVLILGLTLLFTLIYSSVALFEKSVEKVGIASIVASEFNYTLTSDESSFLISGNKGTISVAAGESKFFDITIQNGNVASRYKMYYKFSGVTILNVEVGISEGLESNQLNQNESTTVRVGIINNSNQTANLEIGVQGGYSKNATVDLASGRNPMGTVNEEYVDPSGANTPVLAKGMIPVVYDEANDVWEVANTASSWYSYDKQKWANAVTTSTASYRTASPGTEIPMTDINSMWVWIPRYKYKISNYLGSANNITDPNLMKVEVVFENETTTTGVSEATYRAGITESATEPYGTNSNYYTHPAFRNIANITYDVSTTSRGAWDKELPGIWVGKFETSTDNSTCNTNQDEASCKNVNPIIKPDVKSLIYQNVSTEFDTALKFAGGTRNTSTGAVTFTTNSSNAYGLNTTSNTTDTHMMKNTEWGAVAILSQSKYGKMGNASYTGANKEVYINNSSSMYTGRSGGTSAASATAEGTHKYNMSGTGTGASTTGTIYGVYDMSGGAYEYTMGNWAGTAGSSEFTTFPSAKYYDKYNGISSPTITKEKAILGDATWETMKWYSDNANSVTMSMLFAYRGGNYNYTSSAGVFDSGSNRGAASSFSGFRSVAIP